MNVCRGLYRLSLHLFWLCLAVPAVTVWAAEDGSPWPAAGKPVAPVEVRWLETGQAGRVSVEITPGVDYDRLELRLLVPRPEGPPAPMLLSNGVRGEVRRAGWYLASPPSVTPRLLVILEIDGHQLGRTVTAPDEAGHTAPGLEPSLPKSSDSGVIPMRAEESRSRPPDHAEPPE